MCFFGLCAFLESSIFCCLGQRGVEQGLMRYLQLPRLFLNFVPLPVRSTAWAMPYLLYLRLSRVAFAARDGTGTHKRTSVCFPLYKKTSTHRIPFTRRLLSVWVQYNSSTEYCTVEVVLIVKSFLSCGLCTPTRTHEAVCLYCWRWVTNVSSACEPCLISACSLKGSWVYISVTV